MLAVAACAATMLGGLALTSVEAAALPTNSPAGVSDHGMVTNVQMSQRMMMRRKMMMRHRMMRHRMMRHSMMRSRYRTMRMRQMRRNMHMNSVR